MSTGPDAEDGEKEHEPSQKKLDDARKRGDVPRSTDLVTAGAWGGLVLALLILGPHAITAAGAAGATLLGQADRMSNDFLAAGRAGAGTVLSRLILPFLPLLALPLIAALLSALAQRSLIFAPEKLSPKLSRVSPLASARHRFGRDGLFEFGKSVAKLALVCTLAGILALRHRDDIFLSLQQEPGQIGLLLLRILLEFLLLAFVISLGFGGVDFGWQWLQHRRRNRMSRQEMIDEHKDADGDPHMKGHRRQRGREIALSQMLQDVAKADVIIVNPTHFAVALKWKRGDRNPPILLAKGVDDIAARIREKAAELGIPIHRDPPTARAIHASVEVGSPIRPEQFKPVAAAIRFAETMRKKAKAARR